VQTSHGTTLEFGSQTRLRFLGLARPANGGRTSVKNVSGEQEYFFNTILRDINSDLPLVLLKQHTSFVWQPDEPKIGVPASELEWLLPIEASHLLVESDP
jgi:hypothetical protein